MKLKNIFKKKQASPVVEIQQNNPTASNYMQCFLKANNGKARDGKLTYVRKEYHERILLITTLIGQNNTNIYGYIDNVLEEHFRLHKDEITELFSKNRDLI